MSAPTRPATASTPAPRPVDPETTRRTYELDRAHVFHSWSAQAALKPLVVSGAEGSWVFDGEGRPLLDFSSQLVFTNIGHSHPKVVAAIQAQAASLATVAPQHAVDVRSEAARLITDHLPGDRLNKVFFTGGGAEAIENAVRLARQHTGRRKVLSRYRSYHGNTQTAIHLTGDARRWPNDSGAEGVVHFFGPYLYRSAFHASTPEEERDRALEHLEQVILLEGPATIAALVLESVPGTAGIMVPPPGYLAGVRELTRRHGIVLVLDEVMAGFGRTGTWFGYEVGGDADAVDPDLVTFAKGVNSGYVPLGGVAISDEVADTFATRAFPGGLTYSGHPLACAAVVATITAMEEEGVVENARRIGEDVLGPGLAAIAERHDVVGEVRGTGVFWAVELVSDRGTRTPVVPAGATGAANQPMADLTAACLSRGLLPFVNGNRTHVVPPCTISADEARTGLGLLEDALTEVFG
jgi:taurine---2-oxoglutarate transaminase